MRAVATVDELRALARDLYRRSDNVPLSMHDQNGINRVGELRDEADALMRRADELEKQAGLTVDGVGGCPP